ncbi:MAG: hypothetical protein WAU75_10550, partial [Solirubrobacteraceae bacterium]
MSSRLRPLVVAVVCAGAAWYGALAATPAASADDAITVAITFGNAGDVPVTGDWDGSGRTQIGVYRPSDATFYLGDAGGV